MTSNSVTPDAQGDEATRVPRYTLRPVITPLPSTIGGGDDADVRGVHDSLGPRAENEDDDGYDPYSDYHDGTARSLEFEADPWR